MGVCTSSSGKKSDGKKSKEANVRKILLLGAGESGKSTLFKNFIKYHGPGFSDTDRADAAAVVSSNILLSMKKLCEESGNLGFNTRSKRCGNAKTHLLEKVHMGDEDLSSDNLARTVALLWEDQSIQSTYAARSNFQLDDNAAYFINRVEEIGRGDYQTQDQDLMLARVRTTGIVESDFEINQNSFRIMDMGGQRGERNKWSKAFESVHAVVFVASLCEYDQVLREDSKTNRLEEAVAVFEEVSGFDALESSALVLVLTKKDLLQAKLANTPLQDSCHDYKGSSVDDAVNYILAKFQAVNRRDAPLAHVVFSATDDAAAMSATLENVIQAVLDQVVREDI